MALIIVSAVLVALLTASAVLKLTHRPSIVQSYARVGVPEDKLDLLAALLLAGAAGLVAGLIVRPLGLAASGCLVVYFAGAMVAHVRAKDIARIGTPLVLELLAIAALVLHASIPPG